MRVVWFSLLLCGVVTAADDVTESGDAVIPKAFPTARYEASWSKNPFLLKTTAVTQPTVSFAQDWVISGMYRNQGKTVVSLMNRQTGERKKVTSEDGEGAEFTLVKANIAPRPSDSSAEIRRGSEVATLTYDDQLLSRPLSTPAPSPVAAAISARPGAKLTPQQAQANARAAVAANPGGRGTPGGGGPIVVGQQPQASQMAQNAAALNGGLPPGVIVPGGAQGPGANNGININLNADGSVNTSNGNATSNPNAVTDSTPATVTRRRRLIPAAPLGNP